MKNLSKYIDHTLLKADATLQEIEVLCQEAKKYDFCSVCVNSSYAKDAFSFLDGSDIKLCCVVGFPLGAMSSVAKACEAKKAIEDGASEIDMVINVGYLKSRLIQRVKQDIELLRSTCKDVTLKVILETALLSEDEIKEVCQICKDIKVDFVKTSTGFSSRGASIEDVKTMKSVVGDAVKIKASGGIRSYEDAINMINAGASRLGASSGVAIMQGSIAKDSY